MLPPDALAVIPCFLDNTAIGGPIAKSLVFRIVRGAGSAPDCGFDEITSSFAQ
jgi:hypothetical protein